MRSPRSSTRAGTPRWRDCAPIRREAGSGASTPASSVSCPFRPPAPRSGPGSPSWDGAGKRTTPSSRTGSGSTPPIAVRWTAPRILAEQLHAPAEPLALLLRAEAEAPAALVIARAARALLDLPAIPPNAPPFPPPPAWLAPHQVPAFERLTVLLARHGGALLADAVGLGKSYVALAVAAVRAQPFAIAVPAVLVPQWRALLGPLGLQAPIITHESLSLSTIRLSDQPTIRLWVVDEAHRF